MPLIVTPAAENADAYISLEAADTYHDAHANEQWNAHTFDQKEAAIRRATAWIDGRYRFSFPGYRARGRLQSLEWPRSDVVDHDGYSVPADAIPPEIVKATAEAALREVQTPGGLAPDYIASQAVKREQVGPLSVEYADASGPASVAPVVRTIDGILNGLFRVGSSNNGFLVRG